MSHSFPTLGKCLPLPPRGFSPGRSLPSSRQPHLACWRLNILEVPGAVLTSSHPVVCILSCVRDFSCGHPPRGFALGPLRLCCGFLPVNFSFGDCVVYLCFFWGGATPISAFLFFKSSFSLFVVSCNLSALPPVYFRDLESSLLSSV